MPNALYNTALQSTMETRMWLVDQHVVSCRNYLGGTHLEIYVDSDLVHCVRLLRRARRKVYLPLRPDCSPVPDMDSEDGAQVLTLTVSVEKGGLLTTYTYKLTRQSGGETEHIPQHYDPCSEWDSRCEQLPGLEHCVSIPTARLATEVRDGPGMDGVVLYKLRIEPLSILDIQMHVQEGICASSLQPHAEWKRYNDFDELYTLVRSAYNYFPFDKLHVPKPPGKTLRKRADLDFIESRRAALEGFLKGLLRLTRASYNPDILRFLGILRGRCNAVGKFQETPTPLYRLVAPLETDEEDEIIGATGVAAGRVSRSSLTAEKEKLIVTVRDAVKSVKQAMSAYGLLPDCIVYSDGKSSKLDAATSARARFLIEAKSVGVVATDVAPDVGEDTDHDDEYDATAAAIRAKVECADAAKAASVGSYQPVLLSTAQDEARRKARDAEATQRSQQYAGSAYIYVSRIKAESVSKQRARRKTIEARKAQAKQIAALFGEAVSPSPRSRSRRSEAMKMYPGIDASTLLISNEIEGNDELFPTSQLRRNKAELEAEVIRQMNEIDDDASPNVSVRDEEQETEARREGCDDDALVDEAHGEWLL